jgi:hypothetical protein
MAKLRDDEIRAIIGERVGSALSSTNSQLTTDRETALDFYYGRPLGNELDGRAQVVTKDLMDIIEWRMPSLMRIFAVSNAVQFDPVGPNDTDEAKQETEYVRHVIWKKNPGFMTVYNWLKDGLLQKVGYIKYWWEDEEKVEYDEYTGLSDAEAVLTVTTLEQEGEVDVVGSEQDEQGNWDIKLRTKRKHGRARIECVPGDEVIINASCRGSIKEAKFVGHLRTEVTRSELIEMGFARKRVEELTSYSIPHQAGSVALARDTVAETRTDAAMRDSDTMGETITLLECYTYIDKDDDGIAELRRLLLAGNDTLEDEEASEIQWESWTPYPVPHRHVGLSEYDRVEDLMRQNTALNRGLLDNVYFTMNPRLIYDKNTVDTTQLGINRPGGHVQNDGPPGMAVMAVPVQPMAGQILPVIEYIAQTFEKRTGVGRNSMGVDADVLAQSTKGAYMQAQSSANQMTEAIARIFAETGLGSLYSSVHRLLNHHQDFSTRIKIGANWFDVNPTEWQEREHLSVSVGLGNSSKEEIRGNLGMMGQVLQQIAEQDPAMVQPKNRYSYVRRLQSELGFDAEEFVTDPTSQEYQKARQAMSQQQPDPIVTAEQVKQQAQLQGKQIDSRDKALDRQQEFALGITKMELDSHVDLATAGIGAEVALRRGAGAPGGGGGAAPQQQPAPVSVQ